MHQPAYKILTDDPGEAVALCKIAWRFAEGSPAGNV